VSELIDELLLRNEHSMIRGRFRRREMLRRLRANTLNQQGSRTQLEKLVREIDESFDRRARRADLLPRISLDEQLPIAAAAERIEQAIRANQVIVVTGETGSGKSTQLR
jgi:ATP-dependent helicase HrpA